MTLTPSQERKINKIVNNFKQIESDNFLSEITNKNVLPNGAVIFTFKKKVLEEYKNTALSFLQKSWCITIGRNGCVKYVNDNGQLVKAKDLYFI